MAISLAIRQKIIDFYKEGLSKHEIATRLKESRTTVIRTIGDEGLQKKLFICQEFNQEFTARMEKIVRGPDS